MDEINLTYSEKKLHMWGVSSNKDEKFTKIKRLTEIYNATFSSKNIIPNILEIEIPSTQNSLVVSNELKSEYEQYNITKKEKFKKYKVDSIIINFEVILTEFLLSEKKQGFYFGDSYEGFKQIVKFAYSLVARQRFTPQYKNNHSFFLANLDNNEDFVIYKDLCEDLPCSIKPEQSQKKEEAILYFLEDLIDYMVKEFIKCLNFPKPNQTSTDKWVSGFFNNKVKIDSEIIKNIQDWAVSRNVGRMHEYTILFKLNEPNERENDWILTYHVQSKNDLSIIIALEEIWQNKQKLTITNYKLHILQELGMAAKVSKVIEKSMRSRDPSKIILAENEALSFMKSDSFILKDFGFIVHIPKITAAVMNSMRIVFSLKKPKSIAQISSTGISDALFDFDYEVAIGDDLVLSKEEFYNLSKMKSGLVNVKGKWVELNYDDLKKAVSFFEKKTQISLADIIRVNSSEDYQFQTEIKSSDNLLFNTFYDLKKLGEEPVPKEFIGELREYQKHGYSWLVLLKKLGLGGILADDMGLGKTIQAITYLLYLKKCSLETQILIVAPTSVIGNWERELAKFAPSLKTCLYHGNSRKKEKFEELIKGKDVIITSYGTIRNDDAIFAKTMWDLVIIDEAQNIKNPFTKQARIISSLPTKHRICLTGTPIENRLSELWSLMNFCNKGILSSWNVFKKKFAEPIELNSDKDKTDKLKKIISPFILRRLKSDKKIITDLPDKTEIKEYCSLTKEQVTLYQAILDESLKKIKEFPAERRMHIISTIIKLKQLCNHPTNFLKDTTTNYVGRSGKLERLFGMIEVFFENDEKCLIFTQFKEMGDILKKCLEEYFSEPVLFLHGQVSRKERVHMIETFQNEKKPSIFILSIKAGGTGINLTAATQVIHFDRWWNPAVENQATDRTHRIGQNKKVFIYKYITSGTIEEKIDEIIERKNALSNSILSRGESILTELDDNALKEIFSLRKEYLS